MHLLHLFHAGVNERPGTALGLLRSWIGHSPRYVHEVAVVGPTAVIELAREMGLPVSATLGAPHGWAELAAAGVRRVIARRPEADAVVCWSPGALRVTRAVASSVPAVACLTQRPTPAEARRLARTIARRRGATEVVCFSPTVAQAAVDGGLRNEGFFLVPPGVDAAWCRNADRAAIRRRWGVADESVPVVAAVSTPPLAADAERVGLALSMVAEAMGNPGSLRSSLRLVCHPLQANRERARRVFERVEMPGLLAQDPDAALPWRTLPGCDLAVVFGPYGDRLALAWAMAAGRAVVAAPQPGLDQGDLHPERHGLIAKSDEPRDLAYCIKRLLEDRPLAAALAERAAARAAQRFDVADLARRLDDIVLQRLHTHTPGLPSRRRAAP